MTSKNWTYMFKKSETAISLTEQEQNIFNSLLKINSALNLGLIFRVAGGWTRDKLLGIPSDDIDIALDKMTGQDFVNQVLKYIKRDRSIQIGKSYTVDANAEKSKHLETTALEMYGLKIDFVNLRSEEYGDSRIPTMSFGDAKTDAERRDLTINALFYNINTREIEDYVGGLKDIKTMTLRTPLDPRKTFLDDPLRMLRLLRFHSKYPKSTVDPEIIETMKLPEIHDAYRTKVSPERAGPEIIKLFAGDNPVISLRILYDTGLDSALFNMPDFQDLNKFDLDQQNKNHEFTVKEHTFKVMESYNAILNDQVKSGSINKKDRILALIASWFHDKGKLDKKIRQPNKKRPDEFSYIGHEDRSDELAESFLKTIGIGKDDREFVRTIVREHMMPHMHHGNDFNRRMMGKLRDKTTIPGQERKDVWKFVLWHAKADDAGKQNLIDEKSQLSYDDMYANMDSFMNAPPPIKPLLNGQDLMQMFPDLDPKSGFINYINKKLKEMQDSADYNLPSSFNNVKDKESAVDFVKTLANELHQVFGKKAHNWYGKFIYSSVYPYLIDGHIKCRIIRYLEKGKLEIENENGHNYSIYESEFKKRIQIPAKTLRDVPFDQYCSICGSMNQSSLCSNCGNLI